MDVPVLTLQLGGPQALLDQAAHIQHGGLFIPVPEPPPQPLSDLVLCIVSPFNDVVELELKVVQIAPGSGMALTFANVSTAQDTLAALMNAARGAVGSVENESLRVIWGKPSTVSSSSGKKGPLYDRIQAMPMPERMQLALHGNRTERQILLRDTNKTIHVFVLKNPRITLDEVRYLAGQRQTNPEALKMIAKSREWCQHPGIVAALVRNPRTPSMIAVRLLDRLPVAEIRRLARSGDVPRSVSQAAKRKVMDGP